MSSICILGRQPAIGLTELESLFGSSLVGPAGVEAAIVALPPENIQFSRLGGTVKLCRFLTPLPTTKWQDIHDFLAGSIPEYLQFLPEGKLQFGISAYGFDISVRQLQNSGLALKKIVKGMGRSVRLIPNQEPALSSAQVLYNHLTGQTGWELVVIKDGNQSLLAQTVAVQDINAYAARDQARPKRDARVGMLPPKLAQIIINLAQPKEPPKLLDVSGIDVEGDYDDYPSKESLTGILDPFCGTGVVMQEALLMGFAVIGTDIDQRMMEYTSENIQWIRKQYNITSNSVVAIGDATSFTWPVAFTAIASETYLGRPFSALPSPELLQSVVQDVDTIHKKFLQNVSRQTKSGFQMCIAVPAWKTPQGFKRLPILDHLEELGYTRVRFVHAKNDDLIYHRPNQVVGRELVVLQRK